MIPFKGILSLGRGSELEGIGAWEKESGDSGRGKRRRIGNIARQLVSLNIPYSTAPSPYPPVQTPAVLQSQIRTACNIQLFVQSTDNFFVGPQRDSFRFLLPIYI